MRTSNYSIPAGVQISIAASGNYLRITESVETLIVEHPVKGDKVEMKEGDDVELDAFDYLLITNTGASDVNVKLTISRDKKASSARVGGSVAVAGDIALDAATIAAIDTSVREAQRQEFGASFAATSALAANTPETIVAPAANLNGIILHKGFMHTFANLAAIIAKSSAPANVADGHVLGSHIGAPFQSASGRFQISLDQDLFIPAGLGLYFIGSTVGNAGNEFRSALYTIL